MHYIINLIELHLNKCGVFLQASRVRPRGRVFQSGRNIWDTHCPGGI